MALEAVVGSLLSYAFNELLCKLGSREVLDFFRAKKLDDQLLKKLERTLLKLNGLLNDAEYKQITDPGVQNWMDQLKDTVYHADDLLDEIATETRRQPAGARCPIDPVRETSLIFCCRSRAAFDANIESRIKEMIDQLESFWAEKGVLGLTEGGDQAKLYMDSQSHRLPTTSLVEESNVCGRKLDKDKIIRLLLSDDAPGGKNRLGVIAIVGMAGVGKTTLAQVVYNDAKVAQHFDHRVWACVPVVFNVLPITKTILEAVIKKNVATNDLNRLQEDLKHNLSGKKFCIVLDDVWEVDYHRWNAFKIAFTSGMKGSKIIVTTCNQRVAQIMQNGSVHVLDLLSDADCRSVLAKYAFDNGDSCVNPELEKIGNQIATRRCKGLPLAAKMMGCLLSRNHNVEAWKDILENEIWQLSEDESGILLALRLSYHYLPSHLKLCFAYCSIFPKDFRFKKKQLTYSWMAQNFVQQSETKTMEEIAEKYFDELVSRSLLQQQRYDKDCYVMHDLVHGLAQVVAGHFCFRFDGHNVDISLKVRYFSCNSSEISEALKAISVAKSTRAVLSFGGYFSLLRSPMPINIDLLKNLFNKLRHLRELHLPDHEINEIPDSIGKLMHLRYLDLSNNDGIKKLPESICNLCNLQTLLLSGCDSLSKLPVGIGGLIRLRHLDISGTNLKEMPMGMSKLKHLHRLTDFVVGKHNGSTINSLREFNDLHESLSVYIWQNVRASAADLMRYKNYLECLKLKWDDKIDVDDFRISIEMLNNLQPHTNLKDLKIVSYGGTSFSSWLGNCLFDSMTSLLLKNCKNCLSLPPLGQLPSLKELTIRGMPGIKQVGHEFYREDVSSTTKPFQALKTLRLEDMEEWETWDGISGAGEFSTLEELSLVRCPKLRGSLPKLYTTLKNLEIRGCPELQFPNLYDVDGFSSSSSYFALEGLRMEDSCRSSLQSLPLNLFPRLADLRIQGCASFERFLVPTHRIVQLQYLESLRLVNCERLQSLPERMHDLFPSLRELLIGGCPQIESFPEVEWALPPALSRLYIENMPNLVSLNGGGLQVLRNLKELSIRACPRLESLPEEGLPDSLKSLYIKDCPLVADRCRKETGADWPKIVRIPVILNDIEHDSLAHFPSFDYNYMVYYPYNQSLGYYDSGAACVCF